MLPTCPESLNGKEVTVSTRLVLVGAATFRRSLRFSIPDVQTAKAPFVTNVPDFIVV